MSIISSKLYNHSFMYIAHKTKENINREIIILENATNQIAFKILEHISKAFL